MKKKVNRRWSLIITLHCAIALTFLTLISLQGCSARYIFNAATTQAYLLLNREDIATLINHSETSPTLAKQLQWVVWARDYARSRALQVGEAYSTYSAFDREALSWVVAAAYPLDH